MKTRILSGTGVSLALALFGTSALGESRYDQMRGAEWQPERALTQNLPAPRYRNLPMENERYRQSRDQFQQPQGRFDGEDFSYDHKQIGFDDNHRQFRRNRGQGGQDQYSSRQQDNRMSHRLVGTLLRIKGDYFVVSSMDGDRQRLHVGEKTLVDAGIERGDRIIAQVKPDGHAIAIRKDRGRRGEYHVQPGAPDDSFGYESKYHGRNDHDRSSYQNDYGRDQQRSDHGPYRP